MPSSRKVQLAAAVAVPHEDARPRRLSELGFTKLFNEIDMKEAARQGLLGLGSKPLDTEHIQGFLEDFGLDAEFGVHSRIRGLSGARREAVVVPESSVHTAALCGQQPWRTCSQSASCSRAGNRIVALAPSARRPAGTTSVPNEA